LEQAGADTFANPTLVGRKLPQQQTGHRIRRLAGPDGTRQGGGDDRRRRKTVIADDTIHLVNDHDCREALLLLGQCARSEPPVEGLLAAGELVETVNRRQRFWG
jgi:hypothetical protein